jgi:hypothetical protein
MKKNKEKIKKEKIDWDLLSKPLFIQAFRKRSEKLTSFVRSLNIMM